MTSHIKKLALVSFVATLAGCSGQPLTVTYTPSSTLTAEGSMDVGSFSYRPSEINPDIRPNQIRNTAIGSILFDDSIANYFERAVFTEARFTGIKVGKSDTKLTGEIKEFLADDLGYSVDWTLDVEYVVTHKDGAVCYSRSHDVRKTTNKFVNIIGSLNEVMRLNIERVISDKNFIDCIQPEV